MNPPSHEPRASASSTTEINIDAYAHHYAMWKRIQRVCVSEVSRGFRRPTPDIGCRRISLLYRAVTLLCLLRSKHSNYTHFIKAKISMCVCYSLTPQLGLGRDMAERIEDRLKHMLLVIPEKFNVPAVLVYNWNRRGLSHRRLLVIYMKFLSG